MSEQKRMRLPLGRQSDVANEMARVYRLMKGKQIPMEEGTKLIYALSVISKSLEADGQPKDKP